MTYSDTLFGGRRRWLSEPPKDIDVRIPEDFLRAVCFVCVKESNGDYHIGGTAFFLFCPYESNPTKNHLFVVTANHNLEEAKKVGYDKIYLSINTIYGNAEYYEVNTDWTVPVRTNNLCPDVAVVLIDELPEPFIFAALPTDISVNSERGVSRNIGIGEELAILGLFTLREGRSKNIPILRTGTLSAMIEEPIPEPILNEQGEEDLGLYNAYLAEIRSIKGLSGSPVFVMIPPFRRILNQAGEIQVTESPEMYILGLIRGHWSVEKFEDIEDFSKRDEKERINTGIAAVTPISDILNVINGTEMMKKRKEKELQDLRSRTASLDSAFNVKTVKSSEDITVTDFEKALKQVSRKISEPVSEKKETSE